MELKDLKGIGPSKEKLLHKLNIYTTEQLLTYYPYQYEILARSNIDELNDEDKIIIDGTIEKLPHTIYLPHHMTRTSFPINTGDKIYEVIFFNQIYLKRNLNIGSHVIIIGKYHQNKDQITATTIQLGTLTSIPIIEPKYAKTKGLSQKEITTFILNALNTRDNSFPSYIPNYLEDQYHFLSQAEAIKTIHFPKDISILKQALVRLKYEELLVYMLKINYLKEQNKKDNTYIARSINPVDIEKFINHLPFTLTKDQITTSQEIINDLITPKRMNRLLQGDVGSGKTIVSFIAAYANYLAHYQTAIMVPSEVLATQHYQNALAIFQDYPLQIALLTSKIKIKEKQEIYEKIAKGQIDIIIGTQSLIQEKLKYHNLGLIIVDEQHRFGVNQRDIFKNKGIAPDILSMSATPIPRTYALTIYGDLDISSIKTKPQGRKPIITKVYPFKDIKTVLISIQKELELGHQIYVIAPTIEEQDELTSVEELKVNIAHAFPKETIKVIHGKQLAKEKKQTMSEFKKNTFNILIATTIIEVGVDVQNASTIVIFSANKFGLSTLHQLRGRVGRSNIQSYCYLIDKVPSKRLDILEKTNDGFEISDYDFKTRGSGEIFGTKQSGTNSFKIADLNKDYKILLQANNDAKEIIKDQEYFSKHQEIFIKENLN